MDDGTIREKVQKLLNLASNNPSEEEAQAAFLKAQELILKYHIDNPYSIEDDKVVAACHDLGTRRKTEFVLMISVVVAENFRSKTIHGGQKVFFFGMEEDAWAALEVFRFLLHYGDSSHDAYFVGRTYTTQQDRDWRYGYIVGIKKAFESRKGYELMTRVPDKVMQVYDSIRKSKTFPHDSDAGVKSLGGAFLDGYSRGRKSLDQREIEG